MPWSVNTRLQRDGAGRSFEAPFATLRASRINKRPALPYRQRLAALDHSSWMV